MRNRLLWIALGVVALALAIAPVPMGFMVERTYAERIGELADTGAALRAEGRFERGLWTSRAVTELVYAGDGKSEPASWQLVHRFSHGPLPLGELLQGRSPFSIVLAVIDTQYAADPSTLPRIAAALGERPLVRLLTWVRFDRSLRARIDIPAIALGEGEPTSDPIRVEAHFAERAGSGEGEVRVAAFTIRDGDYSLALDASELRLSSARADGSGEVDIELEVDGVRASGPEQSLRVGPIAGRIHGLLGELGFERDEVVTTVESLALAPAGADTTPDWSIASIRVEETGQLDTASGLRGFDTRLSFEKLATAGASYGPGRLELAARRIDATAARDLRDAMGRLDADALDEAALVAAREALLAEWLPRVFASSPELVLSSLSLATPSGELAGTGGIRVDGAEAASFTEPAVVWQHTSASLDLRIPDELVHRLVEASLVQAAASGIEGASPEALAQMAAMLRESVVAGMTAQGLLVHDGERYRVDLGLAQGVPTVNGQPFDPGMLSGASAAP